MARTNSKFGLVGFALVFFFALLFLLPGCFMGYLANAMAVRVLRARHWQEVPATILTVDCRSGSDDEGGTTYRVGCTYQYTWAGRTYTGKRVGFSSGSDNVGSWHETTYDRLQHAHDRGRTVPCFVNPADPSEVVLDREVRFGLLAFYLTFLVAFGSVGAGMMIAGTAAWLQCRRTSRRLQLLGMSEPPPWILNDEWAAGVIRPKLASRAAIATLVAVVWNVGWSPLLIFLPGEVRSGDKLALLTLGFPLVGVLLILWAARLLIRKRKFGQSRLELQTIPGVIGGFLRGELVLAGDLTGLIELEAALNCVNTVTTGSGKSRSTQKRTLWTSVQNVTPATTFGQAELRVPLDFQIPGTCRPCDDSDSNDKVAWQLTASGATQGVDLALDFDVPVFQTEESDLSLGESAEKLEADRQVIESEAPPIPGKIREEQTPEGYRITASAWPGVAFAAFMLFFALIIGGVAVFAGYGVYHHNWFLLIFLVVFGLFDLLMWLILASFLGSCSVTCAPGRVRTERRFGPIRWSRELLAEDIQTVFYKECASNGDRRWYRVSAKTTAGRDVTLVSMIPTDLAARWFVRQITMHAGLQETVQTPQN